MTPIASFDVFDTVLTRAVGSPRGLFLLLGRELAAAGVISCDAISFAEARTRADRCAYARHGRDGAVDLDLISRELALTIHLDEDARRAVVRHELTLEARLLRVVPDGARAVAAARARGDRIRFLSDMYLPSAFIEGQLRHHALWNPGDRLYVSGDVRASKRTGALYRLTAQLDGCTTAQMTHTGNDRRADVVAARRAGVRAIHAPVADLTPDEAALDAAMGTSAGLSTVLAAAARLARLTVPASDPVTAARRDVTADVIGPLLIGYVLWLLHRAVDLGLEHLCFMARDGQVLLDIARRLQPRLGPEVADLRLSYLHASRQAWNIAAVTGPVAEHLPWLLSHAGDASTRGLLKRLALSVEDPEVAARLHDLDIPVSTWDTTPTQAARERLLGDLAGGPLGDLARDAALEQRQLVVDHLRQEGVFKGACGLVDVVARGTQIRAAVQLAIAEGAEPPHGFLMGIQADRSLPEDVRALLHAWLYDDNTQVGPHDHRPLDVLSIAACAADHGTLLGYRRDEGGRVQPVLRQVMDPPVIGWGLPLVRTTLASMADALVLDQPSIAARGDVRDAVLKGIDRLWTHPGPVEAQAWGTYPYEYGSGTEPRYVVLAPPTTWRGLYRRVTGQDRRHWTAWTAASILRASAPLRMVARAMQDARARVRQARRRLRRRSGP